MKDGEIRRSGPKKEEIPLLSILDCQPKEP